MSFVAEFARQLHESVPSGNRRPLEATEIGAGCNKLADIRVLVFDVYGTLVNYRKEAFDDECAKQASLLDAFDRTAERFLMKEPLAAMNPADKPEATLRDFYHGLIGLRHEIARKKGVQFPEVRIEEVWEAIILMLGRHGYRTAGLIDGDEKEIAKCVAYFYHFHAIGRGFYPGVAGALEALKRENMRLGIISNGQFYTPIDLTLFLRDQAGERYDDFRELFDPELTYFSYEYGMAKPERMFFRRLYDTLYEYHVLPSQTVFVGNDLVQDIVPAAEAGMKTALFAGDRLSTYTGGMEGRVTPDIAFTDWGELPGAVTFYRS